MFQKFLSERKNERVKEEREEKMKGRKGGRERIMETEREEEEREKRKIGRKEGRSIGRKKWEGKRKRCQHALLTCSFLRGVCGILLSLLLIPSIDISIS